MADRATCWSITINNPEENEIENIELPAGWKLQGQLERGAQGTLHYQAMLTTPQVRFSAVKKILNRAHIEPARNKKALEKYVNKEESREKKLNNIESRIPTLFEYQTIVAEKWVEDDFKKLWQNAIEKADVPDINEVAMCYLDSIVEADINAGRRGAEFIAINPMWRASWKKFWRSIINRHGSQVSSRAAEQADGTSSGSEGGTED